VTSSDDKTLHVWDAEKFSELSVARDDARLAAAMALRPNPLRIVKYKYENRAIEKLAVETTEEARRLMRNEVISVAFSSDGKLVAAAESSESPLRAPVVTVSNIATNEKVVEIKQDSAVRSIGFSSDGQRIVIASDDGTAQIRETQAGQIKMLLTGHTGAVTSAAFSPDGTRIVTSSEDATIRIWDADTGRAIFVHRATGDAPLSVSESIQFFHKSGDGVKSAAFSPGGNEIVTASPVGARIWNVQAATSPAMKLVENLCGTSLVGLTTITRDEMRLAGYSDDMPQIDVCTSAVP
jgi:WD40 repeat protein